MSPNIASAIAGVELSSVKCVQARLVNFAPRNAQKKVKLTRRMHGLSRLRITRRHVHTVFVSVDTAFRCTKQMGTAVSVSTVTPESLEGFCPK